ncbi:MAG: hypothetical protein IMY72_11320 [Bacteroidetes bacterium]|nr:hypothetical protein [Bacteroidota bacterium]
MKTKLILKIFLLTIFLLNISSSSFSQRCDKKRFYDKKDLGNYDYRGQSSYSLLSPGDTVNLKIVVYSGQDYRIFAACDPTLGQVELKIIKQIKKRKKIIKQITSEEVPIYQKDEHGELVLDEWGDYIENGSKTLYDTIWGTKKYIETESIYSSINSSKPFWDKKIKKTQVLIVKIIVPEGDGDIAGCSSILIGHKAARKKPKFKKM